MHRAIAYCALPVANLKTWNIYLPQKVLSVF